MGIALKILLSLGLLILGALLLYSSAYAFGVDERLKSTLQWAMVALSLAGVGLVWKGWLPWAVGALGAVALIFGLILFLARQS